jgi:hypothetical protein
VSCAMETGARMTGMGFYCLRHHPFATPTPRCSIFNKPGYKPRPQQSLTDLSGHTLSGMSR